MTHEIIAQEVGEVFSIAPSNPPTPVLSVSAPPESHITFHTGQTQILRIAEDGFYVRGVKVPADKNEAAAVYRAFKNFLTYHALTRP